MPASGSPRLSQQAGSDRAEIHCRFSELAEQSVTTHLPDRRPGRINEDGEIEYRPHRHPGEIRGYRIELGEIEAVLLDQPAIAQAAVTTWEIEPGRVELVAYYAPKTGLPPISRSDVARELKLRLPDYMVPAYLEELPAIPMTVSNKADLRQLPNPTGVRLAAERTVVPPSNDDERFLAEALADVLKFDDVSVDEHFFDDLGANSLLMARFCARVRRRKEWATASMRDIYLYPTVARLAKHLSIPEEVAIATNEPCLTHRASNIAYWTCGAAQLLFYGIYSYVGCGFSTRASTGYMINSTNRYSSICAAYCSRALLSSARRVLLSSPSGCWWGDGSRRLFPSGVCGTFASGWSRHWSAPPQWCCFAAARSTASICGCLAPNSGKTPQSNSKSVPVCTDLISIGDNTILRKESMILGYRAQSGYIHTGPVTIGRNAFVGVGSTLDIHTKIGDGAQLGHSSSLQRGQSIPDGERWHGSPAVPTTADYCKVPM